MDVDERKTRPKSLWTHLYQQVQEQSDFCDVTVQVETWTRKYHWSVLSASPFFLKLYESKFEEQQTGLVKLTIGTSISVQSAIHFLYGQRPKIDIDNVADILETAEFLMIEELKALCVKKLKSVTVSLENCLPLLMLSSRYDFLLEKVSEFSLAHLPELLLQDQMLFIDKASVRFIFTDQRLSYISAEEYFRFLLKWIGHCPSRKSDFAELLSYLNMEDISPEVLHSVTLDCLYESDKLLCNNLSRNSNKVCDVLLAFPPERMSGKHMFYTYNFKTKTWFQISFKDDSYWDNSNHVTLQNQKNVMKFTHGGEGVTFYNLVTKQKHDKDVNLIDDAEKRDLKYITVSDDEIYCIRNSTVFKDGFLPDLTNMPALSPFDDILSLQLWLGTSRIVQRNDVSCLYVSEKEEDSKITLKPMISVYGYVRSLCVADNVASLLIPDKKELIVFAVKEHMVAKIDLSAYIFDKMSYACPCHTGGVYIVTKTDILQIDFQVTDTGVISNMLGIFITKDDDSVDWKRRNPVSQYEITQDKVVTVTQCLDSYENRIRYQILPERICVLDKEEYFDIEVPERFKHGNKFHFIQTQLPKEALRCHIDCPHCKYKEPAETRFRGYERDSDSDEYVYFDESDDYGSNVYYGLNYYDVDSSEEDYE